MLVKGVYLMKKISLMIILTISIFLVSFNNVNATTLTDIDSMKSNLQDLKLIHNFDSTYDYFIIMYDASLTNYIVLEYTEHYIFGVSYSYYSWNPSYKFTTQYLTRDSFDGSFKMTSYDLSNNILSTNTLTNQSYQISLPIMVSSNNITYSVGDSYFDSMPYVNFDLIITNNDINFTNNAPQLGIIHSNTMSYVSQSISINVGYTFLSNNDIPLDSSFLDSYVKLTPPIDSIGFMVSKKDITKNYDTILIPFNDFYEIPFITSFNLLDSVNNTYSVSQGIRYLNTFTYYEHFTPPPPQDGYTYPITLQTYVPFNEIEYYQFTIPSDGSDSNSIYVKTLDNLNLEWVYSNSITTIINNNNSQDFDFEVGTPIDLLEFYTPPKDIKEIQESTKNSLSTYIGSFINMSSLVSKTYLSAPSMLKFMIDLSILGIILKTIFNIVIR
jgi:hypothetical protein